MNFVQYQHLWMVKMLTAFFVQGFWSLTTCLLFCLCWWSMRKRKIQKLITFFFTVKFNKINSKQSSKYDTYSYEHISMLAPKSKTQQNQLRKKCVFFNLFWDNEIKFQFLTRIVLCRVSNKCFNHGFLSNEQLFMQKVIFHLQR